MGKKMFIAGGALIGMFASASAGAQAGAPPAPGGSAGNGLEDIVVTARRRAESLLAVPVSVAAISAATLERASANDLGRIALIAPQVNAVRTNGGSGATFSIRGIGSPSVDPGVEQSVLIDIDNVQVGRGRIVSQGLFDLRQVEVLKGPQVLFFGKNSPAGVISVKSADPGDHLEGYGRIGYEFRANERYFEGAISGPLSDTLGARLAVKLRKMDGWVRNIAPALAVNPLDPFGHSLPGAGGDRSPSVRDIVGRITLVWTPSADFNVKLKVLGNDLHDNGDGGTTEAFCAAGITKVTDYGLPDPASDCRINYRKSVGYLNPQLAAQFPDARGGKPFTRASTVLTSLTAQYNMGGLSLVSSTGYYWYDVKTADYFSETSYATLAGNNPEKNKSLTQEFRVNSDFAGRINFTVGAFGERTRRDGEVDLRLAYLGPDPVTGNDYSVARLVNDKNDAASIFGQIRWNIVPDLELAGGARYTHERKRVVIGNAFVHAFVAPAFFPAGQFIRQTFKDDNVSPEATLSWHPRPDLTVYALYKTGYKSGGFSNPSVLHSGTTQALSDEIRFRSEKARGGELGVKGRVLDRRVEFDLSLFRYDFDNLQVVSYDSILTVFKITNAAKARTQGFDASVTALVGDGLTLNGAIGYARARYRSFPTGPCTTTQVVNTPAGTPCFNDLSGGQLPRAPDWVGTAGANYEFNASDSLKIGLNSDVRYSASYFLQENSDASARQKSYWMLNAGARIFTVGSRWELALIGRNLTDRHPVLASVDKPLGAPGQYIGQVQRPSEVILQGTVRF